MAKDKVDYTALKDEDIAVRIKQSRERLVTLRTQAVTEKVENNAEFGRVRREIARAMTEQRVRQNRKAKA